MAVNKVLLKQISFLTNTYNTYPSPLNSEGKVATNILMINIDV